MTVSEDPAVQIIHTVLTSHDHLASVHRDSYEIAAALRAAGYLNPDEVSVPREALRQFLTLEGTTATNDARYALLARLDPSTKETR